MTEGAFNKGWVRCAWEAEESLLAHQGLRVPGRDRWVVAAASHYTASFRPAGSPQTQATFRPDPGRPLLVSIPFPH